MSQSPLFPQNPKNLSSTKDAAHSTTPSCAEKETVRQAEPALENNGSVASFFSGAQRERDRFRRAAINARFEKELQLVAVFLSENANREDVLPPRLLQIAKTAVAEKAHPQEFAAQFELEKTSAELYWQQITARVQLGGNGQQHAVRAPSRDDIVAALAENSAKLTAQEERFLRAKYVENKTRDLIAREMGVSKDWVSQLSARALDSLLLGSAREQNERELALDFFAGCFPEAENTLSNLQKDILSLRTLQRLSRQHIAEKLDTTPATVAYHLKTAYHVLRSEAWGTARTTEELMKDAEIFLEELERNEPWATTVALSNTERAILEAGTHSFSARGSRREPGAAVAQLLNIEAKEAHRRFYEVCRKVARRYEKNEHKERAEAYFCWRTKNCIPALTPEQEEVAQRILLEGQSPATLAQEKEVSQSSIGNSLARARRNLLRWEGGLKERYEVFSAYFDYRDRGGKNLLTERQEPIFTLRYRYQKGPTEIAQKLGISLSAVSSRLIQAEKKILKRQGIFF